MIVDIAAPDLMPYEVLNALRYNPGFGESQLVRTARALEKFGFWMLPLKGELAERCVENSLRYGISVYDSAYLSLGVAKDVPVFTVDARLIDKVRHGPSGTCHRTDTSLKDLRCSSDTLSGGIR